MEITKEENCSIQTWGLDAEMLGFSDLWRASEMPFLVLSPPCHRKVVSIATSIVVGVACSVH